MLPIALTCPIWWVARWTARMLASLAVVVACSFGAATLPAGAAPAAPAVVAGPAYASTPAAAQRPEHDRAAERQARPVGAPAPRATDTLPAGPQPVPAGRITAPVGLRAPPAR
ncbi:MULTISPECIES: hypothetical protein [unclassified Micromonospora]|uniref:hypothetical protein n=1 Tax=unclassified Micromonospora TaxID=2617518 RepID=UPI001B3599A5|nr:MULTISPECIES: hypothetical protein [unclassified Micromonospora]MBQ1046327.1 hypothetical protein [Micromonospora sp. C72]MBQ1056403.1 hypothetical protein [Micromonospora sp. C32]